MTALLQVSDPHFGTEVEAVVDALLRFATRSRPDAVVFSGDITQRARRSQFAAARAFVERLGIATVLAVPGNHDIPLFNIIARIFFPYWGYQRTFGRDLEFEWTTPEIMLIGINTTRPWRHKDGEVSDEQIESVTRRLQTAHDEQLRVIVVHQPVHVIRPEDECNLLHGHERAIAAWSQAGADLIVGGHIHLPYVRPLRVTFNNLPRAMWAVQAGTALSSRVRGDIPNSVNVIRYDPKRRLRCVIERWDYDAISHEFALIEESHLQLERGN